MAAKVTDQVSTESNNVFFDLISLEIKDSGPRLGRLSLQGRQTIDTPHYLALSSRGTVPHLSQDMLRDNTSVRGLYVSLEDCGSPDPGFFNILETMYANRCAHVELVRCRESPAPGPSHIQLSRP